VEGLLAAAAAADLLAQCQQLLYVQQAQQNLQQAACQAQG
jgi:hypothetical protein